MGALRNLLPWRRRRLERELERELRHHLDRRTEDLVASGLSEPEARRLALVEFGGIAQAQEEVRDIWVWRWLDDAWGDLRHAMRTLRRSPGFTVTALVSLALGIGANTAIFSLIDQVLLRTLAVPDAARLVHVDWRGNSLANSWGGGNLVSLPLCRDLDEQSSFFDGVFCRRPTTVNFSTGQQHERVRAELVSGAYFSTLGARPALGRLIDRSDDVYQGAHPVVVVSFSHWTNRLGGTPDAIGRKVLIDNYPMTVIGVAPADFPGVDPLAVPAVWIPVMMTLQAGNLDPGWNRLLDRRAAWLHGFGRLKPGVSLAEATAGLQPWFRSMLDADMQREGFPEVTAQQRSTFLDSRLDLLPAPRGVSDLRGVLERPLWVLMVGTSLLLLLACLNVAGLLLARGASRVQELTTRMALGASRARVTCHLLAESLLIAVGGGLLGLVIAPIASQTLVSFLAQDDVHVRIDPRVAGFAVVVSVITAVLCGLGPALQRGRVPLITALRERSRIATGGGVRLRKLLVAGQMAFTLLLLIGAGLFVQTLARLHERVGFDAANLLMLSIDPPGMGYGEADAERVMRRVAERLRASPIVERSAIGNTGLLGLGWSTMNLTIQADQRRVNDRVVSRMRVGPGFFAALGAPVLAGREFDEADVRAPGSRPRAWRLVIVNESFARRYFAGRNPIGARIGLGTRPTTPTDIEIIGVVQDFSRRSLRDGEVEQVFFPYWDQNSGDGTFYVRTRGRAETAVATLRALAAEVDPVIPVSITTFNQQIDRALATERMLATLASGFGAVALLLSMVGVYGVLSFVVAARRQEIGVRLALGATRAAAVWLIARDASIMIAIGTAIAVPAAWGLRRVVETQLFGVEAIDAPTIALATVTLGLVALGAAMLPAWRAASLSPTEALRLE